MSGVKTIFFGALILILTCSVFAWYAGETEFIDGKFIFGWYENEWQGYDPDPDFSKRYQILEECGNHTTDFILPYFPWSPNNSDSPSEMVAFLDKAHQNGLKVIVDMHESSGSFFTDAELTYYINLVKNHPATMGYYIGDDLGLWSDKDVNRLIYIYNFIKNLDTNPDHLVYGEFTRGDYFSQPGVQEYLAAMDVAIRAGYIYFDPQDELWRLPTYQEDVAIARSLGKKYMMVDQTFECCNSWRLPTHEEYRYLTYFAISIGVDGLINFVYPGAVTLDPKPAEGFRDERFWPTIEEIGNIRPILEKGTSTLGSSCSASNEISWIFSGEANEAILIAVNNTDSSVNNVTFTLSGLNTHVQGRKVVDGFPVGSAINLNTAGQFTDNFASGRSVNIYWFKTPSTDSAIFYDGLKEVLREDFETVDLSEFEYSGSVNYDFDSAEGISSLKIGPASYVRTRTTGDDPQVRVLEPSTEVWVDFWTKVEGETYWYNTFPIAMGPYSENAITIGPIFHEASEGHWRMLVKDNLSSGSGYRYNYLNEYELGKWYHFKFGLKIQDFEGNGLYSIFEDKAGNQNWTAVIESQPFVPNQNFPLFGRVQWSINGLTADYNIWIDDLRIYQPALQAPQTCGDDGTFYYFMDFNQNCFVDIYDLEIFAQQWLNCTDPQNPNCN